MNRAVSDAGLTEQIAGFHEASRRTYGAPRIHLDLTEAGIHVGRKRVAQLMRAAGLGGVRRREWRHGAKQNPDAVPAPDPARTGLHRDRWNPSVVCL